MAKEDSCEDMRGIQERVESSLRKVNNNIKETDGKWIQFEDL